MAERIAIIGPSGAGKSTLARRLSARLGLPLVHLDREFWLPGWVERPKPEWRRRVADLAAAPRWVIDGNYGGTLDLRLRAADLIIWLDFDRTICMRRVLWRWLSNLNRRRDDMAEGCVERVDLAFLRYIWSFPEKHRPQIVAALDEHAATTPIERLTHPRDVAGLLNRI